MPNEDYAIVLDYLPKGKSTSYKSEPIAQVIGTNFFTLLEVVPKEALKVQEKVYVGKEQREKVMLIKRRIKHSDLTSTAVSELDKVVEAIVSENSKKFVDFFNTSSAITLKRHKLELLPGMGKKHREEVLAERVKKPFDSFEEIEKRISSLPNPRAAIVRRVIEELSNPEQKHYLFVRPPSPPKEFRRRRF